MKKIIIIFLIFISTLAFSITVTDTNPNKYPLSFIVTTSKDSIKVGDSVEITVKVKIDKNHPNFDPNENFVFIDMFNQETQEIINLNLNRIEFIKESRIRYNKLCKENGYTIFKSDKDLVVSNTDNGYLTFDFTINVAPHYNAEKFFKSKEFKIVIPYKSFYQIDQFAGYPIYYKKLVQDKYIVDGSEIIITLKNSDLNKDHPKPRFIHDDRSVDNVKAIKFNAKKKSWKQNVGNFNSTRSFIKEFIYLDDYFVKNRKNQFTVILNRVERYWITCVK